MGDKPPTPQPVCDHVCHKRGLNPWIESCPMCGCANPAYDPESASDIDIAPPDVMPLGMAIGILLSAKRGTKQ